MTARGGNPRAIVTPSHAYVRSGSAYDYYDCSEKCLYLAVGIGLRGRVVRTFPFDVKAMLTELSKARGYIGCCAWVSGRDKARGPRRRYPRGAYVAAMAGPRPVARGGGPGGKRKRAPGEGFIPLEVLAS